MEMIRIRTRLTFKNFSNKHTGKSTRYLFALLHPVNLDSDGRHRISNLLDGEVALQIIFEPIITELHIVYIVLFQIIRSKQLRNEILLVENLQIRNPLSDTYELDRDVELVGDPHHNPALGGTVKFGDHQ